MRTLEDHQAGQRGDRGCRRHRPGDGRRPTTWGLLVTQIEQLPEVLPTVHRLGSLVNAELEPGAKSRCSPAPRCWSRQQSTGRSGRPAWKFPRSRPPGAGLLFRGPGTGRGGSTARHGAGGQRRCEARPRGAIAVDPMMRTGLPSLFAAGDCVVTQHRLLGDTYLPLGTTAHKQGRVAGQNASAVTASSPEAPAPRSSRSLTRPPPAPGCGTTKPGPPDTTR